MRPLLLVSAIASLCCAERAFADPYVAPPAASVPGYFATVLPCKVVRPGDLGAREPYATVKCSGGELDGKSLRELAILRNTIYARYGWDGFRKPWLHDHFHAQPWFKPNKDFSYKLVSDVDKKNAHLIAAREQSLSEVELFQMKLQVYARHGKVWNDLPKWTTKAGKEVRACKRPPGATSEDDGGDDDPAERSNDCKWRKLAWYKPDPSYTDALLTAEDKIELGLISRALGSFALDGSIDYDEKGQGNGLDRLLPIGELRQLSMRDLRLLRNTIYARRGRTFKSQILRDHFAGMSWYKINAAYSDKLLSKTDTRNISIIKSVENEFGGPLSDEDWLTEPATDGA